MRTLTIELPSQAAQSERNLRRWNQILADPAAARFEFRLETDRHGNLVMSPPPAPRHGRFQSRIGTLLAASMPPGAIISECPISTADGVKAADIVWTSPERMDELGDRSCFLRAPELCVEVLSPANTESEMQEKMALYFDAGALEVWLCDELGRMTFFAPGPTRLHASTLCPRFPSQVTFP